MYLIKKRLVNDEREKRLIFFDNNIEELKDSIQHYEKKVVPFRNSEEIRDKLNTDKTHAVNRIEERHSTVWNRITQSKFYRAGYTVKGAVDAEITDIAREKLKNAGKDLTNSKNRALEEIEKNTRSWVFSGLSILLEKKAVCEEVKNALIEKKTALEDLSKQYHNFATNVLGKKDKKIDIPGLKNISLKIDYVEQIDNETKNKIENNKVLQKIKSTDENLRKWLLQHNPSIAPDLETLLLDNATGNGKKLEEEIVRMKKNGQIHYSECDLFLEMTRELRGDVTGKKKRFLTNIPYLTNPIAKRFVKAYKHGIFSDASAEYYRSTIRQRGNLNPPTISERLEMIKKIGQRIELSVKNNNKSYPCVFAGFGKTNNEDENKNIILIKSANGAIGAIDVKTNTLVFKEKIGTYRKSDLSVSDMALKKNPDPNVVYFNIQSPQQNKGESAKEEAPF